MSDTEGLFPAEGAAWPCERAVEAVGLLFARAGLAVPDALLAARIIVESEARGAVTHGLSRVPAYVRRLRGGGIRANGRYSVLNDRGPMALSDGQDGMGQVVAYRAMEDAIARARKHGIGLVVLRNGSHFGQASTYTILAAEQSLVGFALSNASPRIAPWGGVAPLLGNNPWSVAFPRVNDHPIVVDMANSVASAGKIRQAELRGEQIPLGWALDPGGRDTRSPEDALKGSLLPFGGYKGAALTLVVGLLTGALAAGRPDWEVQLIDDESAPQGMSQTFMAVDLVRLHGGEAAMETATRYAIDLLSCRPKHPGEPVRLPGAEGYRRFALARAEGLRVPARVIASLRGIAREP